MFNISISLIITLLALVLLVVPMFKLGKNSLIFILAGVLISGSTLLFPFQINQSTGDVIGDTKSEIVEVRGYPIQITTTPDNFGWRYTTPSENASLFLINTLFWIAICEFLFLLIKSVRRRSFNTIFYFVVLYSLGIILCSIREIYYLNVINSVSALVMAVMVGLLLVNGLMLFLKRQLVQIK